jgi:hypothetical protein
MITLPLNLARIVMGHVLKGRFNAVKQLSQFLGRKSSGSLMRESHKYLQNAKKKGMPHKPITGRYVTKYDIGWKDKFRTPMRYNPRKEWAEYSDDIYSGDMRARMNPNSVKYEELIGEQFAKRGKVLSTGRVKPLAEELLGNNKFAKQIFKE